MSTSPSFSTRKPHFIIGLGYLAVVLAFLAYHNETAARRDIALANRDAALANREAALAERDTTLSRIADLSKTTSMDLSKILPALQHVEHLSANSVAAETEPGFKSAVVKLARGVALELRRLSQFILSNPQADERQEQDTAVDKGRSGRHRPSFKVRLPLLLPLPLLRSRPSADETRTPPAGQNKAGRLRHPDLLLHPRRHRVRCLRRSPRPQVSAAARRR